MYYFLWRKIFTSKGAKSKEVMSRCPFGTGVSTTNLANSLILIFSERIMAEWARPRAYAVYADVMSGS